MIIMITAKSATQELQKKHLDFISYLEREGDKQVRKSLEIGINYATIIIREAPGTEMLKKAEAVDIACNYYKNLGYRTNIYSDNNRVELEWNLY